MTPSDAAFKRASRDPFVRVLSVCMGLVDLLFFGRVADSFWNRLCSLQDSRYMQVISLDRGKR